jgi:hypothetical protein
MASETGIEPSLLERVDGLLGKYGDLDHCADEVIDAHIAKIALGCPGVPLGILQQCEIEAYARGYSISCSPKGAFPYFIGPYSGGR